MAALIDLCNQALAEIWKGQIASLNEGSLEARECQRFAQTILNEMADWSDDLPLGRKRATLAQVPNSRPNEWRFAYATPADIAAPVAIIDPEHVGATAIAGPFNQPDRLGLPLAFIFEGGIIYTNVEKAGLDYSSSTIDAADLSPLLQRAFVLELAARIAGPLVKDAKIVQAKAEQAEIARARALADEENKAPRREVRYVSEAELARMGIGQ